MHVLSLIAELNNGRFLGGAMLVAGAAGIAANALLMQPVAHPDPLMLTRAAPQIAEQLEAGSGEQREAVAAQRDELVLVIQNALREEGYYSGEVDGIAGPRTMEAVRMFEAASGAASEVATAPPAAPVIPPEDDEGSADADLIAATDNMVAAVQGALARAAYGPLKADGIFGPQTGDAIMRFQRDHGLPVTGEITDALVVELRASGALEDE